MITTKAQPGEARSRQARPRAAGRILGLAGLAVVLALVALIGAAKLTGRGLGLSRAVSTVRAVLDHSNVVAANRGNFTDVVFVHQSVGQNLIVQGGLRDRFTQAGYDLWDQSYNAQGLTRPDGRRTGYGYSVPNDITDPDSLARIFAQPINGLPINTMSGLMQHDVIVLKSCFTMDNIDSDELLARYKTDYLNMRAVMDKHPEKLFILLTPPPMNPAETSPAAAARVRDFANFMKSDAYLAGHPNVRTFDLFNLLAESQPAAADYNMLARDYRDGGDSHPNVAANKTIAPLVVDFVVKTAQQYEGVH